MGAFPIIRHNEIRDLTAELLSEVCCNVSVEPSLQPLTGESLTHATANCEDFAQLDVKAQGFWGLQHQCAHFNVRVFNPNAPTYHNLSLDLCFRRHEGEKRQA